MVAIGRDVKAQAHGMASLEHARWRAVQVALVRRQCVDGLLAGRGLGDEFVGLDGLVLVDQLLVLGAGHLLVFDLLGTFLQLGDALGHVLVVHVDAVDHRLDGVDHALDDVLGHLGHRAALGISRGVDDLAAVAHVGHGVVDLATSSKALDLLMPDVRPVLVAGRDAATGRMPLFQRLALRNRLGFDWL